MDVELSCGIHVVWRLPVWLSRARGVPLASGDRRGCQREGLDHGNLRHNRLGAGTQKYSRCSHVVHSLQPKLFQVKKQTKEILTTFCPSLTIFLNMLLHLYLNFECSFFVLQIIVKIERQLVLVRLTFTLGQHSA